MSSDWKYKVNPDVPVPLGESVAHMPDLSESSQLPVFALDGDWTAYADIGPYLLIS